MLEASAPTYLSVGNGSDQRQIAVLQRTGSAPGLFWLGGFRSEMVGTKAEALDQYGDRHGLAVTRFDYSGHGASGGAFADGTITRWLDEALSVFEQTTGPQVVIGSSMGGWLALLLNRRLRAGGNTRVKALILIAPAVDMTRDLMRTQMSEQELRDLDTAGFVDQPSEYSAEPYRIFRTLLADGERHLLFGNPIETGCPVTILQGGQDTDVPPAHALKLVAHLVLDPVTLTLVPDGDHRLSRPDDIRRLTDAVSRAVAD